MSGIPIFKVIVIGDKSVGKSSLTVRFCNNKFTDTYAATQAVDIMEKTIVVDDEPVKLQIWDTAGEEVNYRSMTTQYFRTVKGIVLVYDMTKIETFKSLHFWLNECSVHGVETDKVPYVLVGSKSDLKDDTTVTTSMGKRFAKQCNMEFYETSAKLDNEYDKINDIFTSLARDMKKKHFCFADLTRNNNEEKNIKLEEPSKPEPTMTSSSSGCC